jgi:hypothetical protein
LHDSTNFHEVEKVPSYILVAESSFLSPLTLTLSPRWCLDRRER